MKINLTIWFFIVSGNWSYFLTFKIRFGAGSRLRTVTSDQHRTQQFVAFFYFFFFFFFFLRNSSVSLDRNYWQVCNKFIIHSASIYLKLRNYSHTLATKSSRRARRVIPSETEELASFVFITLSLWRHPRPIFHARDESARPRRTSQHWSAHWIKIKAFERRRLAKSLGYLTSHDTCQGKFYENGSGHFIGRISAPTALISATIYFSSLTLYRFRMIYIGDLDRVVKLLAGMNNSDKRAKVT